MMSLKLTSLAHFFMVGSTKPEHGLYLVSRGGIYQQLNIAIIYETFLLGQYLESLCYKNRSDTNNFICYVEFP